MSTSITILNEDNQEAWSFKESNVAGGIVKSLTWGGVNGSAQLVRDGMYSVELKAYYTAAADVFQIERLTVEVDATQPVVAITSPTPLSYLSANPLEITGSTTDERLASYKLTLSGETGSQVVHEGTQPQTDYKFATLHDLPEGPYTLTVAASDLGEIVTTTAIPFVLDRTAPVVSISAPASGTLYGGEDRNLIDISGLITESNLAHWQFKYSIKGTPLLPTVVAEGDTLPTDTDAIAGTIPVGAASGLADGSYVLSLSATDKAGLKGEQVVKFDLDHTPPELAITAPAEGAYVTEPMDLVGTAKDLHLQEYTLEIAEGACDPAYEWSPIASGTKAVADDKLGHWQLMPPDGDYCLKLTALDQVGYTAATSLNVKVDTHPPEPPLLSGQLQGGNTARLSWSSNSEPDLAGYNLYREGQKLNGDLLDTVEYLDPGLAEGSYAWQVTAVDLAGLESARSAEVRLVVDLTPPESRIISPGNNATVTDLVSIKGTAFSKDDFREYRLSVGAGEAPSSWQLLRRSPLPINYGELTKWDTAGLSEGAFSLKLEAEDLSGNINTQQITVTVDNQPPQAPELTSAEARGALSAEVDIVWDANGESDLAGYLLYRNDELANVSGLVTGNFKPYLLAAEATSYEDLGLPDGTFEYYLLAMDKAGNLSDQSNIITVSIDTHPPHLQITSPAEGAAFEQPLLLRSETADLDIATVQFQFMAAAAAEWTDLGVTLTLPPYLTNLDPASLKLEYGDFVIRAVATDQAGNIDPDPQEVAVIYTDLTPPAAPNNLRSLTQGEVVILTWNANTESDLGGYNLYLGEAITPINVSPILTETFQHQVLSNGEYLFRLTAVDSFGNESPDSNQVTARVYQPLLAQPVTPVGTAELAIIGSGAQGGDQVELFKVVGTELVSAGMATADHEGNFTFNVVLELGNNKFQARASDSGGNTSQLSAAVSVYFDEPPATPTGLHGETTAYDVALYWNANSEPDLAGYYLYRDGKVVTQQNQVRGDSVSASSNNSSAGSAIDGKTGTYWSMSSGYYGNYGWWKIDFGGAHPINKLEFDWKSGYGTRYGTIYAGTSDVSQGIGTIDANTPQNIVTPESPVVATWLKLNIYLPSYQSVSLDEVRIFEEIPLLIPPATPLVNFLDPNLPTGNHHYQVSAVDTLGLESPLCPEVMVPVGDVTPPSPPANFSANASRFDALLDWDDNPEADLAGYNLYREEAGEWRKLNPALLPAPGFTDPALLNGVYTYRVTALDITGNESTPSASASASININLLPAPDNLTVTPAPTGAALEICWQEVSGAAAYNLYRRDVANGPRALLADSPLTATCYQDVGRVNGQTYYYVVTALDPLGNESGFSAEVSGVPADTSLPGPPLFLLPVASGGEVQVSSPTVIVSGFSEAGNTVELLRDGVSQGQVLAATGEPLVLLPDAAPNAYYWNGKISPDGQRAAFAHEDDNGIGAGVYDLRSHEYSPIALTGAVDTGVIGWSPDSARVLFEYADADGNWRLAIHDFGKGTTKTIATATGEVCESLDGWSPDGSKVACKFYQASADLWRVVVYDATTEEANLVSSESVGYLFREWSPDSGRIHFDYYDATGADRLAIYEVGDQLLHQVPQPQATDWWFRGLSADQTLAAYEYEDTDGAAQVAVYNTRTGDLMPVIPGGSIEAYFDDWSPQANRCELEFLDAEGVWQDAVYDFASGLLHLVPIPDGWYGYLWGWSPDGSQVLLDIESDATGDQNSSLYDLASDTVSPITNSEVYLNGVTWLPDSSGFFTLIYSPEEDAMLVYRKDLASGDFVRVNISADDYDWGFNFSPDGRRIFWNRDGRLSFYDLATDQMTYARDGLSRIAAWSPYGASLLLWDANYPSNLWLAATGAPANAVNVYQGAFDPDSVRWLTDGRIVFCNDYGELIQLSPGDFLFPDVELQLGSNVFTAVATDASGNIGPLSEPITVNFDGSGLPDLAITSADIYLYPLSPREGEETVIAVEVRNPGKVKIQNIEAEIYLRTAEGNIRLLDAPTIPEIASGQSVWLDYTWDSSGEAGMNSVVVRLDGRDLIRESDENNNIAAKKFLVAGAPGLTLTTTLNRDRFPAGDVLNLDLTIANSGPVCPVRVETSIEEGGGSLVATLPVVAKSLAYGEVDNELLAWAVGTALAGDYRVRVVLKNGAGSVLAEKLLPFTILPDLKVRANLSSDALHYSPEDEVRLMARVDNLGANLNLVLVEARLVITSNSGALLTESRQLTNLLSGGSAGFTEVWPVALNAPGNYSVALTVRYQGQEVATASAGFTIDALSSLVGTLQVEPKVVPLGSGVGIDCGLNSHGNSAAGLQGLTILLLDNLSQKTLGQSELLADLTASDSWSGSATFAAGLLPVGNFRVLFYRQAGSARVLLAEQLFSVADFGAPLLQVLEPADGAILSAAPQLTVAVSDQSGGVGQVEYQLDQGSWRPLPLVDPATGRYSSLLPVGEADEGQHHLAFRSADLAGNASTPVSVAITLQPLLELTTTVSPSQPGLNQEISGRLNLLNHGWAKGGTLQSWIEDSNGAVLQAFPDLVVRLGADEIRQSNLVWNVGANPPGTYRLQGRLLRNGLVATSGTAEFTIQPAINLSGTIQPDQASYGIDAPVRLAVGIASHGNFTIPQLTARLLLADPAGAPVYSSELTVTDLLAGVSRNLAFTWNSGHLSAGRYGATLSLLVEGQEVATTATAFEITAQPAVSGSFTPAGGNVPPGENLMVALVVNNGGNQELPGLPVRLVLTDAAGAVLLSPAWSVDLAIDASFNRVEELAVQGLAPGNYRLRLECDLAGEIVILAEATFAVADGVPPDLTVLAPLSGATITGPFELAVLATDGGSGVASAEYQVDGGAWLALPAKTAPDTYGLTWTPVVAEYGAHSLLFRASDRAGNIASSDPVAITIALCQPFAALTATLGYQPQPLYQGQEISFAYEIFNPCPEDSGALTVQLLLTAGDDPTPVYAANTTVALPGQTSQAGTFTMASPGLSAGAYTATLRLTATGQAERVLALTDLEVLPLLEDTAEVVDRRHLLVWLNGACIDGESDRECQDGQSGWPGPGNEKKLSCLHLDLLQQILAGSGDYFQLVREQSEFIAELRNPLVTEFLILGNHEPLSSPAQEELREKVNAGAGLITSGWLPSADWASGAVAKNSLLGVTGGVSEPTGHYRLKTLASPITTVGEAPGDFTSWRVTAAADSMVAGRLIGAECGSGGWGHEDPATGNANPAIILHDYGLGRTIYYGFDYGHDLAPANLSQLGALLRDSWSYVHREQLPGPDLFPLGAAPLRWEVTSPDAGQLFELQADLPVGSRLYDYQSGDWRQQGLWQSTLPVAAGASGVFDFSLLAPEMTGGFDLDLTASAAPLAGGATNPLWANRYTFTVPGDRGSLLTAARKRLTALQVTENESAIVTKIVTYLDNLSRRAVPCAGDLALNIQDLTSAITALSGLNLPEIPELRLDLDDLLRLEEGRWYFHSEDACVCDTPKKPPKPRGGWGGPR